MSGGARRIGREICLYFASKGWDVAFTYNTSEREAGELEDEILKMGRRCLPICVDLIKDCVNAADIIQKCYNILGGVNILINNASVFEKSSILGWEDSELNSQINDNIALHFKAPLFLSKHFARYAINNNISNANIINMLDVNIYRKSTHFFAYLISKQMLADLTYFCASEFAPNVRVNGILLGFIMQDKHMSHEDADGAILKTPLQIQGSVRDVVRGIEFLSDSPYVTGHLLGVDGGNFLRL